MALTRPIPLLDLRKSQTLRVRTGLWLVPPAQLPSIPSHAAQMGIAAHDLRHSLLAALPPNANFVALDPTRILELLDAVASQPQLGGSTAVVNLDLLLARLTAVQRTDVWSFLYRGFVHRRSALLIVMPNTALSLLPNTSNLSQWQLEERVFPQVSHDLVQSCSNNPMV